MSLIDVQFVEAVSIAFDANMDKYVSTPGKVV